MSNKPKIVCLCGSTSFKKTFVEANKQETLKGNIVLSVGLFAHSGDPISDDIKSQLDELHLKKIDMCDEVLILNVRGYVGGSTTREIDYASKNNKPIRFWEERGQSNV